MARPLKSINVVPHFMRLHEWIALERGFYAKEGLEPIILDDNMHDISGHGPADYFERPQDRPYRSGENVCSTACHWAVPLNAAAGMGKVVTDLYGVSRFGIFVRRASRIIRLTELAGVDVGIGLMAGSHFAFLETMEKVLPREQIKPKDIGGPGARLKALMDGTIDAANLLDPEIGMAEQKGLRKIASGEFKTLFWVSPGFEADVLAAYFRVLRRAQDALRSSPLRYTPHWEANIPPLIRESGYDYGKFGLGEMLVFEPYTQEEYDQTLALARRWGLDSELSAGSHAIEAIAMHVAM